MSQVHNMLTSVGEVIAVKGLKVIITIFEDSNKETLFYNGEKYKGVSIREHLCIRRGFVDIICVVEGEYLDEANFKVQSDEKIFTRKVELKPIGYFKEGKFEDGVKYLPMIKDSVFLLNEDKIAKMYEDDKLDNFVIGNLLKEELPIALPWTRLFNSHIGIFGNTGSGKSNTLAKLYTVLFKQKKTDMNGRSSFILFDFNGEYTKEQLVTSNEKRVYELNTSVDDGKKIPILDEAFWNAEFLAILYKATESTQKPFLNRIIKGREKFQGNNKSINTYISNTIKKTFTSVSQKRESIELIRQILKIIDGKELDELLDKTKWYSGNTQKFNIDGNFLNGAEKEYNDLILPKVKKLDASELEPFDELIVRVNLQLINDLLSEHVQFEFIQPLLKRMDSANATLNRVIKFTNKKPDLKILTVISMRKCNQEIKKILPLLIAKQYYEEHRTSVKTPPDKTLHFIIDEAHNILSQSSSRELESWKDYRLELFEEIVKEGRKFGVFLTISSQRPADISPTIVSQVHNFFIHRLVNERDLFLIANSISTLDVISKELIPNLSPGCCVITGTSFNLPLVLQVKQLGLKDRPDSEDVNLEKLWKPK